MNQSFKSAIRNPNSAISRSALARRAREFAARFEFGDALLVFYFVIFVRQWFWGLENAAAWCLTFPLALACWYFYVSTKGEAGERPAAARTVRAARTLRRALAVRDQQLHARPSGAAAHARSDAPRPRPRRVEARARRGRIEEHGRVEEKASRGRARGVPRRGGRRAQAVERGVGRAAHRGLRLARA